MRFPIPIYLEEQREAGRKRITHVVRPLFFPAPVERSTRLAQAMTRLGKQVRQILNGLAVRADHTKLVEWTYNPELELREVRVAVLPKKTGAISRFPVVLIPTLGRQVATVPNLPGVWFEIRRGEDLTVKAESVLQRFFQHHERDRDGLTAADTELTGRASVTQVEFELTLPLSTKRRRQPRFSSRGGRRQLDPWRELERVGDCLDWDYPDDLERALKRDALVEEILALWRRGDRRPLLLVGPRKVGKTAVLKECIYRCMADRDPRRGYQVTGTTWHIAPQRLVAGMSFVGQWEERWLAILGWARKQKLRLHLDDLPGLFAAGISSDSNLCAVDVLKPFLERREVSIVAEVTPETLRVLRERDRSFLDLFQVIPVPETTEKETLLVLLAQRRQLEAQQDCRFEPGVMPLVFNLQRRYVRQAAFPGKAVEMLKQLAVRRTHRAIEPRDVLEAFQQSSGLALGFLNDHLTLSRREILEGIRARMVGQSGAVEAAADAIAVAKARLNEPGRPLGCFLFLGPTGVGKTQCAKAIAGYLFGDPERLLRVDLNEYVGGHAVGRLVGTFGRPEGVLTSAIRRQPFAVVLLDEIEKADPEVLDLLLQVLGEARLTDPLGRTADFSNALVIMTSNLGACEAGRSLGFRPSADHAAVAFRKAAEKFFRPEFFNRIDRIIPFDWLGREEIRAIADRLLADLRGRDGLKRRRCELRVSAEAAEGIRDRGFHPELGARALKRVVEREVAHPLGVQLAAMKPGNPAVIRITAPEGKILVRVEELRLADPVAGAAGREDRDVESQLSRLLPSLGDYADRLERLAPVQVIKPEAVRAEQRAYFAGREQLMQVRSLVQDLQEDLERGKQDPTSLSLVTERIARRRHSVHDYWRDPSLAELLASQVMRDFLLDLEQRPFSPDVQPGERFALLLREVALLDLLVRTAEATPSDGAVLCWLGRHGTPTQGRSSPDPPRTRHLAPHQAAFRALESIPGAEPEWVCGGDLIEGPAGLMDEERFARGLWLRGPVATDLAEACCGTELEIHKDEAVQVMQIVAVPLAAENAHPSEAVRTLLEQQAQSLGRATGQADGIESVTDSLAFRPIIRITDHRNGAIVDVRTGRVYRNTYLAPDEMRALILAQVPWPSMGRLGL